MHIASGEFQIQSISQTRLAPRQESIIKVQALTHSVGGKIGELVIASNDADEAEFNVPLRARVDVAQPEIGVVVNGNQLQSGRDTIRFGNLVVGDAAKTIEIVIKNTGHATLDVRGINHPTAVQFSSISFRVAAGEQYRLRATVTPRRAMTVAGDIVLLNNDRNKSGFRLRVSGRVTVASPEIAVFYTASNPLFREFLES